MAFKHLSDDELMVIYQKGTAEAFQELYCRYSGKIFGYLKNKIKNDAAVSDIFQEVFMKLHSTKHLYKGSFPFKPWLFTITQSALIDYIRKDKKRATTDSVDVEQLVDIKFIENDLDEDLAVLEKLPESQRAVLQMRYLEEKKFQEIAATLKTSENNVRQIVSRAIRNLKELVRNEKGYNGAK